MVREQQERHREAQQMDRLREARTSTTCKLQSEGWFEEEIVPFWLLAVLFWRNYIFIPDVFASCLWISGKQMRTFGAKKGKQQTGKRS